MTIANGFKKTVAIFLGLTGLLLIVLVFYPIIEYEIQSRTRFPEIARPLDENISGGFDENLDFTKASNWFADSKDNDKFGTNELRYYYLTVPNLGIADAKVSVGGEDLSENLIQYPTTALPGQIGNTVIFGHSVLPIFFNPKNYLTVFSTLPKMKVGYDIFISFENLYYKYQVESMYEVSPNNIDVLDQPADNYYLSLITCTPPGHPLKPKRLVVRAKLVK